MIAGGLCVRVLGLWVLELYLFFISSISLVSPLQFISSPLPQIICYYVSMRVRIVCMHVGMVCIGVRIMFMLVRINCIRVKMVLKLYVCISVWCVCVLGWYVCV